MISCASCVLGMNLYMFNRNYVFFPPVAAGFQILLDQPRVEVYTPFLCFKLMEIFSLFLCSS